MFDVVLGSKDGFNNNNNSILLIFKRFHVVRFDVVLGSEDS